MNLETKSEALLSNGDVTTPRPSAATTDKKSLLKSLRPVLYAALIVGLSYGSFQFFTNYVIQSVHVIGQSMSPTLPDNSRYVLNRWVYHVRDPQPSEIVVLRDPEDNCFAIKRIIAKQGDTVLVKNGHLYVNGEELQEPYLPEGTPTFPGPRATEQTWVCGRDQYFVLGDNRNNSADSRSYGAVSRQSILGMVTP
jgi:signal peptidase I